MNDTFDAAIGWRHADLPSVYLVLPANFAFKLSGPPARRVLRWLWVAAPAAERLSARRQHPRVPGLCAKLLSTSRSAWRSASASSPAATPPVPTFRAATLGSMPWQADTGSLGILGILSYPNDLTIAGYRRRNDGFAREIIAFFTMTFHGQGHYQLGLSPGGPSAGMLVQDTTGPIPRGLYEVTQVRPGAFRISGFDSVAQRVSGTFAFTATDTTTGLTIPIVGSCRIHYDLVLPSSHRPSWPWSGTSGDHPHS